MSIITSVILQYIFALRDSNDIDEDDGADSSLQVYNEQVRDLLNPKGMLAVRDDSNQGPLEFK